MRLRPARTIRLAGALALVCALATALALVCALAVSAGAQERGGARPAAPAAGGEVKAQPAPAAEAGAEAEGEDERLTFMDEGGGAAGSEAPSAAGLLVRTLGALLLIVGLIVAAGWALRRLGGAKFGGARPDGPELNLLTTVSLGDKRSLSVVRFGGRTLLVGSTAQAVTLIAEDEGGAALPAEFVARPVSALLLEADTAGTFEAHLLQATSGS